MPAAININAIVMHQLILILFAMSLKLKALFAVMITEIIIRRVHVRPVSRPHMVVKHITRRLVVRFVKRPMLITVAIERACKRHTAVRSILQIVARNAKKPTQTTVMTA